MTDETPVATWIRIGLFALLAVPQLVTGLWAVFAPESWFDSFPGLDPRLVAAEPPYNAHLATDAGAGFLATGAALAFAAAWGRRAAVLTALVAYFAFSIPHVAYHTANPAPGLSSSEDALNVTLLVSGLAFAAVLTWGALRGSRTVEAAEA